MSGPTILVIEDNPDDAALIVDGLARAVSREQIEVCSDGAAAVDFLHCLGNYADRDAADVPVFALLDLDLPKIDGIAVLRAIRADACSRLLPVTVLSASDRIEDVQAAAREGANSFIRKPASGQELMDMLAQLARYWMELNIPPPACPDQ